MEMSVARPHFMRAPLYQQIRDHFVGLIAVGDWGSGKLLDSEADLAVAMNVSVGTVRKALDALESEGLVTRRQGRGTIVVDQRAADSGVQLSNLRIRDGERVTGTVVAFDFRIETASAEEARKLRLGAQENVYRSERIREYNGHRFMLERLAMPQRLLPDLTEPFFASARLAIEAARLHNMLVGKAEERVDISIADEQIAAALGTAVGKPLLRLDRLTYSTTGTVLEWRIAHCDLHEKYYMADLF